MLVFDLIYCYCETEHEDSIKRKIEKYKEDR